MLVPLKTARFTLDLAEQKLWRDNEEIALTAKSFDLLCYLVEHQNTLISKQELFDQIWPDVYVVEEALRFQVKTLRSVLGDNAQQPRFIETVRGRGYRFIGLINIVNNNKVETPTKIQSLSSRAPVPPGRDAELGQLQSWLKQAETGQRQLGFISGEPGIGKTTLLNAFLEGLNDVAEDYLIGSGRCVEFYGLNEAYLPVLDALEQLCQGPRSSVVINNLNQFAPSWLLQLTEFVDDRDALIQRVQGSGRERTLREFAQLIEALSQRQTLILCLEDLHWVDSATLELLAYLAQRTQTTRLLIIGSYRPVDAHTDNEALIKLLPELLRHSYCNEHSLSVLDVEAVSTFLQHDYPGLPDVLAQVLQQRCGGNPLFMHNIIDYLENENLIFKESDRWFIKNDLTTLDLQLPDAIRLLIEQRLKHLTDVDQELLKAASAAGFNFSAAAVAAGMMKPLEEVETHCERLVSRNQFIRNRSEEYWPDGTVSARYEFIHALYQEALHQQLTPSQRIRLHQKIGERLEQGFDTQTELVAAKLARHFENSGDNTRAIEYFSQAADGAMQINAYPEAIVYLELALNLLNTLPQDQLRIRKEILLQLAFSTALVSGFGYNDPRITRAYDRALQLSRQLQEPDLLFDALRCRYTMHVDATELQAAQEMVDEALVLAQRENNLAWLVEAHCMVGVTLLYRGRFKESYNHHRKSQALYDTAQHRSHSLKYGFDPITITLTDLANGLWLMGYSDQADAVIQQTLMFVGEVKHPPTQALIFEIILPLYAMQGNHKAALKDSQTCLAICDEYGLGLWVTVAKLWQNWAIAKQKQTLVSIKEVAKYLDLYQESGTLFQLSIMKGVLAELYNDIGHPEHGLEILNEILRPNVNREEQLYEAELLRLQGEFMLQISMESAQQAESLFQQSLTVARQQEAKAWELRTAMSLARLWDKQGKSQQAYELLTPVYDWFTEGFTSKDLQEAKLLLSYISNRR